MFLIKILYFGHKRPFNELNLGQKHVKLSFLSAASDPPKRWSRDIGVLKGFMPILLVWLDTLDVQIP